MTMVQAKFKNIWGKGGHHILAPDANYLVQHPRISEGRHASSNYVLNPHLHLRLLGSLYRYIPCPRPHMAVAIKPQYVYMWPHKALEDYHLFVLLRGSTCPPRKKSSTFHFSISYGLKAGSAKACFAAVYL